MYHYFLILFISDIDECLKPKACGSNAFCTNSYGNYTCTCQEGFQGNPYDGVSYNYLFKCRKKNYDETNCNGNFCRQLKHFQLI